MIGNAADETWEQHTEKGPYMETSIVERHRG